VINMRIRMKTNLLTDALQRVLMKGKYYNGNSNAKNSVLEEYASLALATPNAVVNVQSDETYLKVMNGNATTVCSIAVPIEQALSWEGRPVTVDIKQMLVFLKRFKKDGDMEFHEDDGKVVLSQGNKTATVPIFLNHPHPASVERARALRYHTPDEEYVFGKTTYPSHFLMLSDILREALDGCESVDNARYRFEITNNETLEVSSAMGATTFSASTQGRLVGDELATVEVTGPTISFFGSVPLHLYMLDDRPLVMATHDSVLVKAPFIVE